MNTKPLKIHLPLEGAERHIARIIKRERDATIERTAYAITLTTDKRRYFFADGRANTKLFAAHGQLRRDITERNDAGLLWDHHAEPKDIRYHALPAIGQPLPPSCYCVDITAAYPTTARNIGLIGSEAFDAVMALPKADRLKAFGMLATRRYTERFKDARLHGDPELDESHFRCWYLDLCAYVGSVMEEARDMIGPAGFIMYWVDGIFTTYPYRAAGVLRANGYRCTVERVDGLKWSGDGRRIWYTKGGKETYLSVPQRHRIDGLSLRKRITQQTANDGR